MLKADIPPSYREFLTAVHTCNIGKVRLLIQQKADIHARDQDGNTFLHFAAAVDKSGNLVKLLLEHGADVKAANKTGIVPLMLAASYNHTESMKVLLEHGADPGKKDNEGKPVMYWAKLSRMKESEAVIKQALQQQQQLQAQQKAAEAAQQKLEVAHTTASSSQTSLLSKRPRVTVRARPAL